MAVRRKRPSPPRRGRGEKHGWLPFEEYQRIHEEALSRHRFVIADDTAFVRRRERGAVTIRLEGRILCVEGIAIEVTKRLLTRVHRGREEVRTTLYSYHAHLEGGHNLLRYDNAHFDAPDEFHRHQFDPATGLEISRTILTREQMPTLLEVVDEVERIARAAGRVPAR